MTGCMHLLKGEKRTDEENVQRGVVGSEIQLKGILQLLWINLRSVQLKVKVRMKYRGS